MLIFLVVTILIFLYIVLKISKSKNLFKNKKIKSFNKNNFYDWMNLTKNERYHLSKKESTSYFNKRKFLLEQIRKEYKSISKGDKNNPRES